MKKFLAMFLTLAMVVSMASVGALGAEEQVPAPEPAVTLPADAAASWAVDSIQRWSGYGIVKGDDSGNFNPDKDLSRGELAQILVNMFGLTVEAENTYGDLTGSEWYASAILKCTAAGIMKGDGSSAKAETPITRQETMVMLGRAVGLTPDAKPDMSKFTDAADVADWAAGYMAPLAKMGIVTGSGDDKVMPATDINRASTMALLDKAIVNYVNAPGEVKVDNANGFVVVNVAAKEGEVILSGKTAGVVISAGTAEGKIVAKDLTAATIKMDGTAALSVEGKSAITGITANATGAVTIAKGVTVDTVTANAAGTITNNGTVKELVANAAVKVDNKGTITKAEVKADGVVLGGKKPTELVVDAGTKNPTNEKGEEVKPVTPPSGGNGGGNTPSIPNSPIGTVTAYNKDWSTEDPWIGGPTKDKTSPTYTVSGTTIKASGAINLVENFTGFAGEETKDGYFVTFMITVPDSVDKLDEPVIWFSSNPEKTKIGTSFAKDHEWALIMRLGDKDATTLKNFSISVDWDGSGNKLAKTTYTFDMSGVALLGKDVKITDQAANKIVSNATEDAGGTNPLTNAPAANVNYKAALTGAGIVYDADNYTLNVNTKTLKAWLTTNAENGNTLAALMNGGNQNIWAGLKYSAPESQSFVRVAWDSATGITGKTARAAADWMDFNDLGTVADNGTTLDLTSLNLNKSYDQTMYMLWSTAEGANTATAMTKATIHVKMNVPVTYNTNSGSSIATNTTPYGEAMTLPAAPTRVGYTFAGWYTDAGLTTRFDATKPVTATELNLYAKWASATTIEIMSSDVYALDFYADMEGRPDAVADFGDLEYTQTDTTVAVTGTVNYITGFKGFNTDVEAEQQGNYVALQFEIPADVAQTGVIAKIGPENAQLDATWTMKDTLSDKYYFSLILLMRSFKSYPITIDWDGSTANVITPTTYTIDFSGVTRESKVEMLQRTYGAAIVTAANNDSADNTYFTVTAEQNATNDTVALGLEIKANQGDTAISGAVGTGLMNLMMGFIAENPDVKSIKGVGDAVQVPANGDKDVIKGALVADLVVQLTAGGTAPSKLGDLAGKSGSFTLTCASEDETAYTLTVTANFTQAK